MIEFAMTEGQLSNAATVWFIKESLGDHGDGFRDHPLQLPLHELGAGIVDFTVLTVDLPFRAPKRGKLKEPEEMLLPLAGLCEELGTSIEADKFEFEWYYLELLDRDERVRPLCWISPELLYCPFPDDRERPVVEMAGVPMLMENPYQRSLLTMDDLRRTPSANEADEKERALWLTWLAETWQGNEGEWMAKGLLSYEPMRPWTSQLRYDPRLRKEPIKSRWAKENHYVPLHLSRARSGPDGLYWTMIPLYDVRDLQRIWWAMKQDLYATSVFNLAARSQQDKHLWRRLEERFQLRQRRMSRYKYLIAMREQRVLEWTTEKKTLDQIAQLLVEAKLHPLDPAGPLFANPVAEGYREANLSSARQVAVRIRGRLHKAGVLEKLPPGRPKKEKQSPASPDE
jgi:hypothetical protein